jgi:hypothetical protein
MPISAETISCAAKLKVTTSFNGSAARKTGNRQKEYR